MAAAAETEQQPSQEPQAPRARSGCSPRGLGCAAFAALGLFVLLAPDLMRPRVSANESATIQSLRRVVSAQNAYMQKAGGYTGEAGCLLRPQQCLKDYRGPAFVEETHTASVRDGYVHAMYPGPASPDSRATIQSFAYTAVPSQPGASGVRGFCADSTGFLCFSRDGSEPPVRDGACRVTANTCEPMR